jgi:alkanesulfonate monooxygenase SsuD/methylene tetrahydromethanopterin reductase-like flavin-dependent oxidoreductase (luciferase family)
LYTSLQQAFLALRRGTPGKLKPPVDNFPALCSPEEQLLVDQVLYRAMIGSSETVAEKLDEFIGKIQPDELIVTANIYDHKARLRSFELVAELAARFR